MSDCAISDDKTKMSGHCNYAECWDELNHNRTVSDDGNEECGANKIPRSEEYLNHFVVVTPESQKQKEDNTTSSNTFQFPSSLDSISSDEPKQIPSPCGFCHKPSPLSKELVATNRPWRPGTDLPIRKSKSTDFSSLAQQGGDWLVPEFSGVQDVTYGRHQTPPKNYLADEDFLESYTPRQRKLYESLDPPDTVTSEHLATAVDIQFLQGLTYVAQLELVKRMFKKFVVELTRGAYFTQLTSTRDYMTLFCQLREDLGALTLDQNNGRRIEFPLGDMHNIYSLIRPHRHSDAQEHSSDHLIVLEFSARKLVFVFMDHIEADCFKLCMQILKNYIKQVPQESVIPVPVPSAPCCARICRLAEFCNSQSGCCERYSRGGCCRYCWFREQNSGCTSDSDNQPDPEGVNERAESGDHHIVSPAQMLSPLLYPQPLTVTVYRVIPQLNYPQLTPSLIQATPNVSIQPFQTYHYQPKFSVTPHPLFCSPSFDHVSDTLPSEPKSLIFSSVQHSPSFNFDNETMTPRSGTSSYQVASELPWEEYEYENNCFTVNDEDSCNNKIQLLSDMATSATPKIQIPVANETTITLMSPVNVNETTICNRNSTTPIYPDPFDELDDYYLYLFGHDIAVELMGDSHIDDCFLYGCLII